MCAPRPLAIPPHAEYAEGTSYAEHAVPRASLCARETGNTPHCACVGTASGILPWRFADRHTRQHADPLDDPPVDLSTAARRHWAAVFYLAQSSLASDHGVPGQGAVRLNFCLLCLALPSRIKEAWPVCCAIRARLLSFSSSRFFLALCCGDSGSRRLF